MRISDWSSDVCSSDLEPQAGQLETVAFVGVVAEARLAVADHRRHQPVAQEGQVAIDGGTRAFQFVAQPGHGHRVARGLEDAVQREDAFVSVHRAIMARAGVFSCRAGLVSMIRARKPPHGRPPGLPRSEEHTSELQSLMRNSYAVFCLKKKK